MNGDDNPVPDHISVWASHPGPARVLADAFSRFERGHALAGGTCRVRLSAPERDQVGRVLPATWVASGDDVGWRELRAGLAANHTTLESVVTGSLGPWRNETQERRHQRQAHDRDHRHAVHTLSARLAVRADAPDLPDAALEVLRRGLLGRRTTTHDAERIQHTLDELPAAGQNVGLAVLAARAFGDAHALDRSTALGRAVARFLRLEGLLRSGRHVEKATASFTPLSWRVAWTGAGVLCDQVSSQVLVLNLPLEGAAPAVATARAVAGEPVWLTLRSMAGGLSIPSHVDTVFVCENPSILEAAADRFGSRSQPLICTYGRPSAAAAQLLGAVGPQTVIRVQADADTTGRAIVDGLVRDHPTATPWRMPAKDIMYEEQLVEQLLADLALP